MLHLEIDTPCKNSHPAFKILHFLMLKFPTWYPIKRLKDHKYSPLRYYYNFHSVEEETETQKGQATHGRSCEKLGVELDQSLALLMPARGSSRGCSRSHMVPGTEQSPISSPHGRGRLSRECTCRIQQADPGLLAYRSSIQNSSEITELSSNGS